MSGPPPPTRSGLELAAIGAAARGLLAANDLDRVPMEAFSGASRLLAWACASRACRALGPRSSFFVVRYCLATTPRLDMQIETWTLLLHAAEKELERAEKAPTDRDAATRLLEAA